MDRRFEGGRGSGHVAMVALLLGAGVALRAVNLGGPAFGFDEFYHVFAARSLLEGEGLQLAEGRPYDRASLVTYAIAGAFALFGEGEATARLPALVCGALSLLVVYLFGRRLFGPVAGLVALSLFALSPDAVDVDRFARLYSPLTLFTLVSAACAHRAIEGPAWEGPWLTWDRVAFAALSGLALLVSIELHASALGLVAVVQTYAASMAVVAAAGGRRGLGWRYAAIALALLALEAAAVALPAIRARVVDAVAEALPWYQPSGDDRWFYHLHLLRQYAWLWILVWPATVVVALRRPPAGLFLAAAFWVPFVAMSAVVATKSPRYIVHVLPFAWLVVGGAAALAWPAVRAAAEARLARLPVGREAVRVLAALLAAMAIVLVLRVTPSVVAAARRPSQATGTFFTTNYFYDWRGLARALGPRLTRDALVVAGVPLAVRYYLDRPAYRLMNADREDGDRTGRIEEGRVQRPAQLAALRALGSPVWVLAEPWRWGAPGKLDEGLKRTLVRDCREEALPRDVDFLVFACLPGGRREAVGAIPPSR